MSTLQVLLVELVSVKVSRRIFEFVASQSSDVLHSREFETAQYVDAPGPAQERKECKYASEKE